ncbi:hypothetical protein [Streptomyces soliscabiei]|uniref:hypothetical protein n=1 Tax=Streptomyces soliscabiei TaxID=588897 RepID=UPI0029B47307|nr:hypothetical protein [Streptomyces sp. NY05-11A]MDX2683485.1 hypothetical protein [Streptomyces sp. NY05-11A]
MRNHVVLDCGLPVEERIRQLVEVGTGDGRDETLVDGLTGGVQEGPETLDLVTLHNAIEAAYTRTRYYVENEYIGGPSHVLLRGGRELALGTNPAFGLPNRSGALPPHPDVVDEQESW